MNKTEINHDLPGIYSLCVYWRWLCTLRTPWGPCIPKNVACWDMQQCTKAALREQQRVRYRTEPGVWEMCQLCSNWDTDQDTPAHFLSGFSRLPHVCICTKLTWIQQEGEGKIKRRIYLSHTQLHTPAVMNALCCSLSSRLDLKNKMGFSFV